MIQVNTLRVGNLIQANGPVMEVKSINEHEVELYLHGSESDNWTEDLENCTGIPLTPEILEQCGFKCNSYTKTRVCWYIGDLKLLQSGNKIYLYGTAFYSKDIKYLHQLQNLVHSLTGEELQINL